MRKLTLLSILLLIVLSLLPAAVLGQDAKVTVVTCWGGPEGIGFKRRKRGFHRSDRH